MSKFLVYKGTGGLAHMLRGLNEAIRRARVSNRFLIIDCISNPGFGCHFSDFFTIDNLDYSEKYSDIPVDYKFRNLFIRDIKKRSIHSSKKKYHIFEHNISDIDPNCDENLIVFGGTGSNKLINGMKVNKEIMEKILKEPIINEKYISVHYRNTDLKNSIINFINKIRKTIKKTNIKTVYWASDDESSFERISNAVSEGNFVRNTIPEKVKKNLHSEAKDKQKQVYDCLKDIYFILRSDYFIPSKNSGMSQYVELMMRGDNIFGINSKTIIL